MSDADVAPPSSLDALGVEDPRPAQEQPSKLPSPPLIPPPSESSRAKVDREQQQHEADQDDVLSTKADSEAETIIQSGRESLSPEKRRKHIQHFPRNDVDKNDQAEPPVERESSPSVKKRKRSSQDDSPDEGQPAPKSSPPSSSRPSSLPPVVKKEVSDVQPALTRRDSATSTAEPPANGILSARKRSFSESVIEGELTDNEPPSRSLQRSDSARDRQRREKTQPTPSSRSKDRSLSPPFRSHKRASSGPQQGLAENLHRKQKLPSTLLTNHNRQSSEDRQSVSSSSSASPVPSSHSRRLTSTDGSAGLSGKVANHKKQRDQNGRTRLARACAANEFETAVARHAERPEDLNVPDNAGNTPLQIASLEGCAPIVKFLLEAGCEIDTKNIDKDTPLIDAVENGHLEVIKLLLDAGANPRTVNAEGDEPYDLIPSDTEGYDEIRKIISQAKANPSRKRSSEDNGVRSSSAKGSVPRAISASSPRDSPPAHSMMSPPPGASTSTRRKTVRSEATRNDLLWTKPTQENLCNFAAKGDMAGVATVLNVIQKADSESLIAAAKGGHEDVMSLLLGMGDADPDPDPVQNPSCRPGYNTPMLAAIGRGNLAIIRLLLDQRGFNPTRRPYRNSAYHELAADRKGENWEEEAAILKKAYEQSKSAKKMRKTETKSPKRSRDQEKETVRKSRRDSSSPVAAPRRPVRSPNSARHGDTKENVKVKDSSSHAKEKINGTPRPKTVAREDPHSEHAADLDHPKPKRSISERRKSDASSVNRGEEVPKRRRLIAGRPPQDRDKRRPSFMSTDSLSGREEFLKAHGSAVKETTDTKEKEVSKVKLKRARHSVSPERSRSQGPESGKDSEEYQKKKRRLQSEESSHKLVNGVPKKLLENTSSKKDQRSSHPDTTRNNKDTPPEKRGSRLIDISVPVKKEQKKQDSQSLDRIPMEDSHSKEKVPSPDAKEVAQQDPDTQMTHEEEEKRSSVDIENGRIAKEEEESRKAAEQARIAREKVEEEDRKRKEAEQRRIKQAEEDRQRRAEQERARLAKLRKDQEEQEQRRRDALPSRLRVAANLVGANDPRAKSHAWLKQFMPVVTAKTKQLDPSCSSEVADELWVPNFLVAPLLATNDLQLSQYSSWEKRHATYTQRLNLWRVTRRILVQTDDLDAGDCSFGQVIQRDGETRPKYFDMEHVFWVKLSDFTDLVPHIPHLNGLELEFLKMHIDQEPSFLANHLSRPQVNGNAFLPTEPASSVNGLSNGYGHTHHGTYV